MNGDAATTTARPVATADSSHSLEDAPGTATTTFAARAAAIWDRVERFLVYAGDWLNPILVKETRQALKSFQFTITFVLLLVACWGATIGGVAWIGPRVFYSADGAQLLWWYYIVLAFPLLVVVPYAAFRSLAAEREDNTYELLSITTLKPRQIISGKLGSSVVQMAVYFSAITPCIAFTYLLRGVDVPTIAVLVTYTFFWSLGLSMVGILLATVSHQRVTQVFASVALVAFLLWMFSLSLVMAGVLTQYGYSFVSVSGFWITGSAIATVYVTFFALAFFAAAGMITFTSDNRSTPLRLCMLVQQAALVGWMAFGWIHDKFELEGIAYLASVAAVYWFVMGTFLTAERPGMSQRVKRRLPSSFLGRVFFSWLNPGPASGYMFVVANATAIVWMCLLGMWVSGLSGNGPGPWPAGEDLFYLLPIGWGYMVAYLGLGMLVVAALRRVAVVTMLASVLIHFLVLLAGSGIPTAIQLMSVELRYVEYSLLQITNPIWSLKHLADGGAPPERDVLILLVPTVAFCMLLLNLRGVVRELQAVRISPPTRVLEDEAALHPAPPPQPANPWDEQA
ncbi:MAG: hypothetical protein WD738_23810 [Pirellulales bacterium]